MKRKISIIIPFVNEGEEVLNTIKSILEHSKEQLDIIVINDASDDGYNYKDELKNYPIKYIYNEKRLGVAASRNLGVNICETDYFLLLDAHMRFYDSNWKDIIEKTLDKNHKTILCAQTKVLNKINGILVEKTSNILYWGAYINFYNPTEYLDPQWAYADYLPISTDNVEAKNIPCILGAGYATSKYYWQYLQGLDGLMSYGSDEVLISLKTWLEGGSCKLLPNVTIGHIYRSTSPYIHHNEYRIYNRLYVSYLLCPKEVLKKLFAIEKIKNIDNYNKALELFYKNFNNTKQHKLKFNQIKTKDFSSFERFNEKYRVADKEKREEKEKFLIKSLLYILSDINKLKDPGLVHGKLGTTILLYFYAQYTKNKYITILADSFLEEIIQEANSISFFNIHTGLLGIGWGISFLHQQKFITGNINEILYEIDKKVIETSPNRISNLNLENGLGGIIRYVLNRLYDAKDEYKQIFPTDFLHELYIRSKYIIERRESNNCPETYIEYILFYENKEEISPASIYDILMLPSWNRYSKKSKDISLYGLSGMCLEYILMQTKHYFH